MLYSLVEAEELEIVFDDVFQVQLYLILKIYLFWCIHFKIIIE